MATEWYSNNQELSRVRRLWRRGFNCFFALQDMEENATDEKINEVLSQTSVPPEELRYAEFEFQLYSRMAPTLLAKSNNPFTPTENIHRGRCPDEYGDWDQLWDDLLLAWETNNHFCPIIILRTKQKIEGAATEFTKYEEALFDRKNAWTCSESDGGKYFAVKDYSGLFQIDNEDPAFQSESERYTPPAGMFDTLGQFRSQWLNENARSFMQVLRYSPGKDKSGKDKPARYGPTVQPWQACELLPGNISARMKERIANSVNWASAFRVIRSATEAECDGFVDRLQAYDAVLLSLPLCHYTLNSGEAGKGKDADIGKDAELGGFLTWLKRADEALWKRFVSYGLIFKGGDWLDDGGWGTPYDTGSGWNRLDKTQLKAIAHVIAPPNFEKLPSNIRLNFLQKPHFVYRITMLCRTEPTLRTAMWALGLHRLRTVAQMVATGLPEVHQGKSYGEILTSELAIAMLLRVHIFKPQRLVKWIPGKIKEAWDGAAGDQSRFETLFCNALRNADVKDGKLEGSGITKVKEWPKKGLFGSRLKRSDTALPDNTPDGTEVPKLSDAAYSSPFFNNNQEKKFADYLSDFDLVGPQSPTPIAFPPPPQPPPALTEAQLKTMGVWVQLPTVFHKWSEKDAKAAALAQTSREMQMISAFSHLLANGQAQSSGDLTHNLRPHADITQRWSRLLGSRLWAQKGAAALRCGTDPRNPPPPQESIWDVAFGSGAITEGMSGPSIYCFDARDGSQTSTVIGHWRRDTSGLLAISDEPRPQCRLDNPDNFGVTVILPKHRRTFETFRSAHSLGFGCQALDQFRVTLEGTPRLQVAGLTQSFPKGLVAPSDWGFFVEYLVWKDSEHKQEDIRNGPFQQHLRALGVDVWLRNIQSETPSLDLLQLAWPIEAVGPARSSTLKWFQVKPRLWSKPKSLQVPTSTELAACLLTWPSLYRLQTMFRKSEQARRAYWDVWRIGLWSALTTKVALAPVFGRAVTWADFARTPSMMAAMAALRQRNPENFENLARAKMEARALAWRVQDAPKRGDLDQWDADTEKSFLREVVLLSVAEADRQWLEGFLNGVHETREPLRTPLNDLIDLGGLEFLQSPAHSGDAHAVILGPSIGKVAMGLLVAPVTSPAVTLEAPAGSPTQEYWVSGIVPMFQGDKPRHQAVPLRFDQRVKIRLAATDHAAQSVDYHAFKGAVAQQCNCEVLEPLDALKLEAGLGSWLGDWAETLTLIVEVTPQGEALETWVGLQGQLPWLRQPVEFRQRIASIGNLFFEATDGLQALVWRPSSSTFIDSLKQALPIALDATSQFELGVGLWMQDGVLSPKGWLKLEAKSARVALGSPVASLKFQTPDATQPLQLSADLSANNADLSLSSDVQVTLELQLAAAIADGARLAPILNEKLLPAFVINLGTVGETPTPAPMGVDASTSLVQLGSGGLARVAARLFRQGQVMFDHQATSRWQDISADWLGMGQPGQHIEFTPGKAVTILRDDPTRLMIKLDVHFGVGGTLTGQAPLVLECALRDNFLALEATSFACNSIELTLTPKTPTQSSIEFGNFAKLSFPTTVNATLDLTAGKVVLKGTQPCLLTIPPDKGFTFEVPELQLDSGGLTLDAQVRKGKTIITDFPALAENLNVRAATDKVGKLRIERGKLVEASLQADTQLRLFDDATGVLTVKFTQTHDGLEALAQLEVPTSKSFHIRALYMQVLVASIRLALTYKSGSWSANGGITGSLKFAPEGPLADRLAEYQELFDGTTMHFENLDLAHLEKQEILVNVTPRTFSLANIFEVTLRGFELQKLGDLKAFKGLRLLGDIGLKRKMPNINAQLTLGDITLTQEKMHSLIPKIRVTSIGVELSTSGGFAFKGQITEFDEAKEYGFGGEVFLSSELFPATRAMLKLTRIRGNGQGEEDVPSIAIYAEMQHDEHLAYNVFLRRLGVGVGIHQGLHGFNDDGNATSLTNDDRNATSLTQRIDHALRDPRGLPYPGTLSSWVPIYPESGKPQFLLVGYGLLSFGFLPMNKQHPLVGNLMVAIDDHLDIIAGINGWLFSAPDEVTTSAFMAAPAVRGALGLSPREKKLYGRFLTLPNSQMSRSAEQDPTTQLLRQALNAGSLTAAVYTDPNGSLIEVGYPWEARFEMSLGPARGVAQAGFRFGIYRGTQVIGLNLAVKATANTGFSANLGFANVELSAQVDLELRASFAGVITERAEAYVFADIVARLMLALSARLHKTIRIRGFGCSFSVTLFDARASLHVALTAGLRAAIVPAGIGFDGYVSVALHIIGFGFSVSLRIASSAEHVNSAREKIDSLVPAIEKIIKPDAQPLVPTMRGFTALEKGLAQAEAGRLAGAEAKATEAVPDTQQPRHWCLHVVRAGHKLRVVLFPDADFEGGYPHPSEPLPRVHELQLHPGIICLGAVGSAHCIPHANNVITLTENTDRILLSLEWLRRQDSKALSSLSLKDYLNTLKPHTLPKYQEVVDSRTLNPVPGDFDDPLVLADPGRRSTRLRRRRGTQFSPSYDDHVAAAAKDAFEIRTSGNAEQESATRQAEVLAQLLNLAADGQIGVGVDVSSPADDSQDFNRHLLVSGLSLVLELEVVEGPDHDARLKALEDDLRTNGIAALTTTAPMMFGQSTSWKPAHDHRDGFHLFPGYSFQSPGEVGLTWTLVREGGDGERYIHAPQNHHGISRFRVSRCDMTGRPLAAAIEVRPTWVVYPAGDSKMQIYIRPSFQFLDNKLPSDRALSLLYRVETLVGEGSDSRIVAACDIPVDYQPWASRCQLNRCQVVLQRTAGKTHQPATWALELSVELEFKNGRTPSDAELTTIAQAIEIYRRPLPLTAVGFYGAGGDLDLSLSWEASLDNPELKLPSPDQARQFTIADFNQGQRVAVGAQAHGNGLHWTPHVHAPKKKTDGTQNGQSKVPDEPVRVLLQSRMGLTDDRQWDDWLGVRENAADWYLRVGPFRSDDPTESPDRGTSLKRCRLALNRDMRPEKPSLDGQDHTQPLNRVFMQGTEVAALERIALSRLRPHGAEWLEKSKFNIQHEVLRSGYSFLSRLHVCVNHAGYEHDISATLRGPIVGYRLWQKDLLDDNTDAAMTSLAEFMVLPEPLFRAQPLEVLARAIAEKEPDWQHEKQVAENQAPLPPALVMPPGKLARLTLASGMEVPVQQEIAEFAKALQALNEAFRPCFHLSYPIPFPEQDADTNAQRLDNLLSQIPDGADWYGWGLLEALGCSVTCWVEKDDDRIDPDHWLSHLPDQPVVAVTFSQLPPTQRLLNQPLKQWAVRLFVVPALQAVLLIEPKLRERTQVVLSPEDIFGCALQAWHKWDKKEPTDPNVPPSWIRFIEKMVERSSRFIGAIPDPAGAVLSVDFWRKNVAQTVRDIRDNDERRPPHNGLPTLPTLEGQVHLFQPLDEDYAKDLCVLVEVIRRYDLVNAQVMVVPKLSDFRDPKGKFKPEVGRVIVHRTKALQADRWTFQASPQNGSITALVSVHPAQQAALYRDDLARRVEFIGQRIKLTRRPDSQAIPLWRKLFDVLPESFDWDRYAASWASDNSASSSAPLSTRSDTSRLFHHEPSRNASSPLHRGYNEYRFPLVAPLYEYGVSIQTQAGLRSTELESTPSDQKAVRPLFGAGCNDLVHSPPELRWAVGLVEDSEHTGNTTRALIMSFALCCGWQTLPSELADYWIALDDSQEVLKDVHIPILQLPDTYASYVIVARLPQPNNQFLEVDLIRLDWQAKDEIDLFRHRLLTAPFKDNQVVKPSLVQLEEGVLGCRCALKLDDASLNWLVREEFGKPDLLVNLQVHVERDGVRYRDKCE